MITEATEIRSGSDTTNTMTKTRKGVGDRRLAEPCFAMQNAPRSGRTRRGGGWGKGGPGAGGGGRRAGGRGVGARGGHWPRGKQKKGAAPEHRARRRGSARK